ncbi:MAG: hypothetical protein J6V30_00205 [Paludibacteraceae bacterium]|nr:hypothetical protein [Paludibacteraceae bacterium]
MSRLSDLYKAMETLRKEGLSLNEDLEIQVSELEENIIKKEILPIVTETIAPALKQVQRELVLVVDYVPGAPISVHLSRKRNFAAGITDAKEILPDPQVEHKEFGQRNPASNKVPTTRLRITLADGRVIQESQAAETFRQFVMMIGPERVRSLGMTQCKVPLISNTLDKKYKRAQKPVGNGWYLMTNSSTQTKKRDIENIARKLNIKVKVDIV